MKMKRVIIHVCDDENFNAVNDIHISPSLAKILNINNFHVQIMVGINVANVTIKQVRATERAVIQISQSLAKSLCIPFEILPIHCLYKQLENTLKIGPIISCITNHSFHPEEKLGNPTPFYEELAIFSKRHHIFFSIIPLNEWDKSFQGFVFNNGEWISKCLPTPDAVYNRIGSRSFEATAIWDKFTTFLNELNVPYFNHCFLNKWEIHIALHEFPELTPYLPATAILKDYDGFAQFLNDYESIFVKPVNGSQGRQIMKIKNEGDRYVVFYSSYSQDVHTPFPSIYLLYSRLKQRLNKKVFIIQQGIDLIEFEGRSLDFRILCIKNGENDWQPISIVARVSSENRLVSNLAKGGEQKRPLDVLFSLYDESTARQYVKLMNELAIETARLLNASFEGLYGELGIDIALDKYGKLWIIEVNSKPSKSDEKNDKVRPSTKAIIAYLAHLAGFNTVKLRSDNR